MEKEKNWFSAKEIAEKLGVKQATVWGWLRTGELRAPKFGKEYRVAAKELERFVEDHTEWPHM